MLIDLIQIFKNYNFSSPNFAPSSPEKLCFTFPQDVTYKIVSDQTNFKEASRYTDLPEIPLTEQEKALLNEHGNTLLAKGFYNGYIIVMKRVTWDSQEKIIYFEMARMRYFLLNAVNKKIFPVGSPILSQTFYSFGVCVPFILPNNDTLALTRKDNNKIFTVAGYIEPFSDQDDKIEEQDTDEIKEAKKLASLSVAGLPNQGLGLFEITAQVEVIEELVGRKSQANQFQQAVENCMQSSTQLGLEELNFKQVCDQYSKIPLKLAGLAGFSIFANKGVITSCEVIFPITVNCNKKELAKIIIDREARDAEDHTQQFHIIPLDPQKRQQLVNFFNNPSLDNKKYIAIVSTSIAFSYEGHIIPLLPHNLVTLTSEQLKPSIIKNPTWTEEQRYDQLKDHILMHPPKLH